MSEFPYLGLSVLWFVFALVLLSLQRSGRDMGFLSGLLAAPTAGYAIYFVPDYWDPSAIARLIDISPEDILFSAANGVIAWWIFARISRPAKPSINAWRIVVSRYATTTIIFLVIFSAASMLDIPIMIAAMIAVIPLLVWLQIVRPFKRHYLLSGAVFALIYAVFLRSIMALNPEFIQQWNLAGHFNPVIWNLPVLELIWAYAFGLTWPWMISWITGPDPEGRQSLRPLSWSAH